MDTKEKIIQTAFITFLENGYKSTTYSQLIKATNLSKGSFYHYFNNKEELFYAVIDHYFLSYFNMIDWDELNKLDYDSIEESMRNYYTKFISEINQMTQKGLSRYVILFFETMEIYPLFRETIQAFYTKLKDLINAKNPGEQNAIEIIARYEGLIFWQAVFPNDNIVAKNIL